MFRARPRRRLAAGIFVAGPLIALVPLAAGCGAPQCNSALDCPAETTCILSRCRPAPCVSDVECGGNASCVAGLCTQAPGSVPAPVVRDAGAAHDGGTPTPRDSGVPPGGAQDSGVGGDSGTPGAAADAGLDAGAVDTGSGGGTADAGGGGTADAGGGGTADAGSGGIDAATMGGPVVQIAARDYDNCALLRSGNVKCWGENDTYGELGTGDDLPVGAPMSTPLKNAAFIDLGTGETAVQVTMGCALLRSGRVKCCGRNDFGQLGIGDTTARGDLPGQLGDKLPPVNLGANVLIHEVIGDPIRRTVCALLNQGAAKCWGDNTDGRLGSGQPAPSMGGSPGDLGDALPYLDFGVGNTVAQVVSASPSMCARLGNGQVRCWGASLYGALGTGNSYNYYIPSPPIDLGTGRTAAQIAGGDGMVCAILDDQSLKCWGSGDLGLGDTKLRGFHPGEMGDNLPPVNLGTGVHAVQVATSGNHTCVVLNTGYVKCWGHNLNGELGLGDAMERGSQPNQMGDALPVVQLGDWPVKQVAVGNVHSCALFGNGAVKCWGNYIAIGLGDYNSRGVNKADMGANLAYVDLRDVPMGSGAPDAGPADAGSADAGPPDAGPTPVALADVFDPNQVYFSLSLGTAQGAPPESGTACTNIGKELFAAYPLSAPAAIEGGFTCEAKNFRIHPKTGRILYLGEDAVREFHCDTCDYNDWPANIVSYPFDSASNDPVISTSGCTSAPVWEFALTPEGHIRYQCYQQTAIYDENGNVLSFAGDLTTFAFGANGVTLPLPRSQFPPYLLDASGHMVSITGGPSSFHSMVASRSYGSGFRVAIQPTTGPVELWTITAAGAATKEWTYGTTVPGGAVLDGSWNLVGFASGSIIQISPNATSIKSTAPDPSTTYAFTGP